MSSEAKEAKPHSGSSFNQFVGQMKEKAGRMFGRSSQDLHRRNKGGPEADNKLEKKSKSFHEGSTRKSQSAGKEEANVAKQENIQHVSDSHVEQGKIPSTSKQGAEVAKDEHEPIGRAIDRSATGADKESEVKPSEQLKRQSSHDKGAGKRHHQSKKQSSSDLNAEEKYANGEGAGQAPHRHHSKSRSSLHHPADQAETNPLVGRETPVFVGETVDQVTAVNL